MNGSAFRSYGRVVALVLTLGLQAGIFALLLYSFHHGAVPPRPAQETMLRLPRLLETPAPRTITARRAAAAARTVIPLFQPPAPVPPAPSPNMNTLARGLFDCAPETYAGLTPEQRGACARPGTSLAMRDGPDLPAARSHIKDEAYWQEKWDEDYWTLAPCPAGERAVNCVIRQAREERARTSEAYRQRPVH